MSDTLIANNSIKRLVGVFGREERGGQPIAGIENVGHSSYLSATLSALFSCEEFRVNVILKSKENPDLIIFQLLANIFLDMVNGEKQYITPQQLSELMLAYREFVIEENEEYDPKLFLLELLDNLQESANSADRVGEGLLFPTDVFFCQYQMRWQCRNRHIYSKQENVFITTLNFPEGIYGTINVQRMVDYYMEGDSNHNISCERCKNIGGFQSFWPSSMSMKKHCSILPNVFLLELPLFHQNVSLWSPQLTIDDIIIVHKEKYTFHACICSDLSDPLNEVFVCYAEIWGKWYYFTDEIVTEVFNPSADHLKWAYILFYKKISSDERHEYYDRVDSMIKTKSGSLPPEPVPKTPPLSRTGSADSGEVRRVGLRNQGRTCYMNSAIQCLYHCSEFRGYVIGSNHSGTFHRLLKTLFAEMIQTEQTSIDPITFWRQFISSYPQYTAREEHDTQEFCTDLIARLNGEINTGIHRSGNIDSCTTHTDAWTEYMKTFTNTELVNMFGFLYVETKTCRMEHVWHKYNPAWILVVQLPHKTAKSQLDIQRIIEMSSMPEIVDVRCGECGDASVSAQFVSTLSRPPNILVIQLGIFRFDQKTYRPKKISIKINVNETIRVGGERFSCRALVCHKGKSIAFGHYYGFAKCGTDWYQFNDSVVKHQSSGSIPNADVLFGVYLLFYEKR